MGKKSSFEIILGSYEEFILGYKYNRAEDETIQTFAVHSHVSSIKCLAFCQNLLASGGSDDRIVVYDLKNRKEHCLLTHHNGTINCLQFSKERTHLISGSQDGSLAIVRVGNWQLEKLWEKAHNGMPILDIAIHPSGKLALTIGGDATLRTWNLIKGRQAYIINLNSKSKEPRLINGIKFSTNGVHFVIFGCKYTDIWSLDSGGIVKSVEHKRKITSCSWLNEDALLVGYEDGFMRTVFFKLEEEEEEVNEVQVHENRVKCIDVYKNRIITAASNGEIKVWSLKKKLLSTASAGCRFTCMCVTPVNDDIVIEASAAENTVDLEAEDLETNEKIVNTEEKSSKAEKKKKKKRKLSEEDVAADIELEEDVYSKKERRKLSQNPETSSKKNTKLDFNESDVKNTFNDFNVSNQNGQNERTSKKSKKNRSKADVDTDVNSIMEDTEVLNKKKKKDKKKIQIDTEETDLNSTDEVVSNILNKNKKKHKKTFKNKANDSLNSTAEFSEVEEKKSSKKKKQKLSEEITFKAVADTSLNGHHKNKNPKKKTKSNIASK